MSNVPKLRFKEFSGEWIEKKLDGFLMPFTERVPSNTDIPIYSSSRTGLKPQSEYFDNRELANEGEYGVVPRGYFTYRHMSDDLTFKFNINEVHDKIAVSKEYPVFTTTEGLDSKFLLNALNFGNAFKRYAIAQKAGGTRTRLYFKKLCGLKLLLPTKKEQEKIASFITLVDAKIEQLTKKEKLLKQYKKGVMQQIFSQEIRFKADDGSEFPEWEEKKLSSQCTIKKGAQLNKDTLTEDGDYPALNGGIHPSGYTTDWNTESDTITISEGGNSCGYVNFVRTRFWSGGHNYSLQDLKHSIDVQYLYQYLKFNEEAIMRLRVGSGLPNIQKGEISNFKVSVPCLEEQNEIANFLSSIDSKIEQVQKQLDSTKDFKKALLQQMFV